MKDPQKKYRLGTVLEGLNQFYGANLTLDSDVSQDTFGRVTKHNTHNSQEVSHFPADDHKATTKNRHNITTHTNMKNNQQKRSTKEAPPWNVSVKILLLEGLNRFNGTNLTLNSDVDQDT